jgi:hypothetical protein
METYPRFLVMYSGGICSWAAARRIVDEYGPEGVHLLFADTIVEDEDLYRFLIEGAADLCGIERGVIVHLASAALAIPPVEADRMAERKAALASLRVAAQTLIPSLHWIADGRTPWEVFRDERFIGNSRTDPCSKILKRQLMDRWREEHCDRLETTLVFGLDWSERGRIEGDGKEKPGHRALMMEAGWRPVYPLDERPYLIRQDIIAALRARGIGPPRLYGLGFPHNNCGGNCVKMGLGQARHLYRTLPDRYRWHAAQERQALTVIGTTALPFLTLRGGGKRRRVSMERFGQMVEREPDLFADHGWGCGGGCAVDD